ncbi:uncharacterized protein LOC113326430 [Papaver somniferum]|uniref:uncharacterized protein LOC113326430 n=1 Tax=Papaver somniferum TaxID=3469 RepID=UPI000E6F60A9|nr:uncharacterized protein LOC113326430 [Papaver somniferum]
MFVENAWIENITHSENNLVQTLESLGKDFGLWNKNIFKNIFKNKEEIIKKLDRENAKPGHLVSRKVLKKLEDELETWNKIETIYWLEYSRDRFFKEHDRCTTYFHVVAFNRRRHNSIHMLRDEYGLWIEGKDQLDLILKNHFAKISSSSGGQINHIFENLITAVISEEENNELVSNPEVDEIKMVLFSMNPWWSSGPDGYPPGFFKPIAI